eukprot:8744515-Pyramimonas_sp.AAC.1
MSRRGARQRQGDPWVQLPAPPSGGDADVPHMPVGMACDPGCAARLASGVHSQGRRKPILSVTSTPCMCMSANAV